MKATTSRHAFLIIAHDQPAVLETLLHRLDDARNTIFLHIDRKSPLLYEHCQDIKPEQATLHLLDNRLSVFWGNLSQVRVEYALFEAAHACGPFDYYHLLSGTDLPIKCMDEIHDFFSKHQGREFVGFWNNEAHNRDLQRKVRYYYPFTRFLHNKQSWGHRLVMPLRNLILAVEKVVGVHRSSTMEFRKGSNWVSLTQEAIEYLINRKAEIMNRMDYTLCPDEIFVQTWLWNSPFRDRLFDTTDMQRGSMRAIDWERGNPYIWTAEDSDELNHSPLLFARKFNETYLFEPTNKSAR